MTRAVKAVKQRPAEFAAGLTGTGFMVAALADHNWLAAASSIVGYVPAAATYLFEHGGISGVLSALWSGRK